MPHLGTHSRRDGDVARHIAREAVDLGRAVNRDWVNERVAEHGYPWDEFDEDWWFRIVTEGAKLMRPGPHTSTHGDRVLETAVRHTFRNGRAPHEPERWLLE